MKEYILLIIEKIHLKLFQHPPSEDMKRFLRDLSFVAIAAIVSKFLILVMRIYGGNIAGAEAYGKFALILSIAGILILPMSILFQGLMKYIPEAKSLEEKNLYFSTVFWSILGIAPITIFAYSLVGVDIGRLLGFSSDLFGYVLLLTIVSFLGGFYELVIRAYDRFNTESIITIVSHAAMFIIFLGLSWHYQNLLLFLIPYSALFTFKIVLSFLALYPNLRLKFSIAHLKSLSGFTVWIFLITVFQTMLVHIDKIALNKFLNIETVGIFQAYYDSSIIITGTIITILISVLSPKLFQMEDKKPATIKLKKLTRIILLLEIIFLPILIVVLVKFGFNFPLHWSYVAGFTMLTIISNKVYIWTSLYYTLHSGFLRLLALILFAVTVLNIIGNILLVPQFGIIGSLFTTICGQLIILYTVHRVIDKNILHS